MSKQEAYKAKARAKLEEHEAKLHAVRAKLKGAAADVRLELEDQVDGAEKKLARMKKKFASLADEGDEVWEEFTGSVEKAWDGLGDKVKSLFA